MVKNTSVNGEGTPNSMDSIESQPDLLPPKTSKGVLGWMRKNLFSSPLNSAATLILGYLLYSLIVPFLNWTAIDSQFNGSHRLVCDVGKTAGYIYSLGEDIDGYLGDPDYIKYLYSGADLTRGENIDKRQIENTFTRFESFVANFHAQYLQALEVEGFPDQKLQTIASRVEQSNIEAIPAQLQQAWSNKDLVAYKDLLAQLSPIREWGSANDGACWIVVKERLLLFAVGSYDRDKLWRVALAAIGLIFAFVPVLALNLPHRRKFLIFSLLYPVIGFYLVHGGVGLETIPSTKWGGLMVTVMVGFFAIFMSFPIGIPIALGRRSKMPIVKGLSIMYVELWRGVPLVTILFMSSVVFPLFLPGDVSVDKLLRACVGLSLFAGAVMAEVIRGGLQAIPKGQFEAAEALGLSYWKMMRLIVLPQALRIVIPAILNTFISIFKDTTLMIIIGITELLMIARMSNVSPEWVGFSKETFGFVAIIFFVFCFSMSRYSHYLEERLRTEHKN